MVFRGSVIAPNFGLQEQRILARISGSSFERAGSMGARITQRGTVRTGRIGSLIPPVRSPDIGCRALAADAVEDLCGPDMRRAREDGTS